MGRRGLCAANNLKALVWLLGWGSSSVQAGLLCRVVGGELRAPGVIWRDGGGVGAEVMGRERGGHRSPVTQSLHCSPQNSVGMGVCEGLRYGTRLMRGQMRTAGLDG